MSILICHAAGAVGSAFTYPSIPTWYATLQKPFFNPPNWIFGPVWLTLYTLMGIAAYIVWEKGPGQKDVKVALGVFAVQLVLNSIWSIIFFGLHLPLAAFIEIIVLLLFIIASVYLFNKVSRTAALLLVPYVIWVGFASVLNLAVALLNG